MAGTSAVSRQGDGMSTAQGIRADPFSELSPAGLPAARRACSNTSSSCEGQFSPGTSLRRLNVIRQLGDGGFPRWIICCVRGGENQRRLIA